MDIEDAVRDVIDALNGLTVPYMLVGSFSSNYYGVGRMTKDADFVVELGEHSILDIGRLLGPRFRVDPQMGFETVTMSRRYVADVIGTPFKIEFFLLNDAPYNQERFRRRRQITCSIARSGSQPRKT